MNPTDFICGLMRLNSDALGFIPSYVVRDRFVARGMFILQRTRSRKPIGYIIHGPVHRDGSLYIHQACIELDNRNRGFGRTAVDQVVTRATRHQARTIYLRCAADLEAIDFWSSCGFLPTHLSQGGARRQRTIVHFRRELRAVDHLPAPTPRLRSASC